MSSQSKKKLHQANTILQSKEQSQKLMIEEMDSMRHHIKFLEAKVSRLEKEKRSVLDENTLTYILSSHFQSNKNPSPNSVAGALIKYYSNQRKNFKSKLKEQYKNQK